jgi:pyrrolysine biosynthesis protein PylD
LTENDVSALRQGLDAFEVRLQEVAGIGLRDLALRSAGDEAFCVQLYGARVAAIPISTGEGLIPGFGECIVAVLEHLGCEAWVSAHSDVRGIQDAVDGGAEVLFLADDHRFIALNVTGARSVDNDPATADGYVTALEAASGGLYGREVLLLGLGPVGRAAARRLLGHGATVHVVEPDAERLSAVRQTGLKLQAVDLEEGLAAADLIFDATPAADLIDAGAVGPETIAAVPGLPSAFTPAAQAALGARHIHEPLAIGVAVMAARALR